MSLVERIAEGTSISVLRRWGGESLRYSLVSALALGCDVSLYMVLIKAGLRAAVAGALGYVLGIFVHYTLSAIWVFPDRHGARRTAPTFAKFFGTGLLGLAMTAVIIDFITGNGLAGAFMAKAAAAAATYVTVFLLRRLYVFAPARHSQKVKRRWLNYLRGSFRGVAKRRARNP